MKKEIKKLIIKIGRGIFYKFEETLDIQQLENGFVFHGKYYQTIKKLAPFLIKSLENHFKK